MGIFVNRTLNMKQISAIGLDMDYTLVRYDSHAFEQMTYEEIKKKLIADYKYPSEIKKLKFDLYLHDSDDYYNYLLGRLNAIKKFFYVFFDNRKDNSRVRRQVNEKKFLSNNRT